MIRKIITWFLILTTIIAAIAAIIVFYPQNYCCADKVVVNNFNVYFCGAKTIPSYDSVAQVLTKTQSLIEKSEIYNPDIKFNIFIPGADNKCKNFPLQFKQDVAAQTIAFTNNTFVTHADFDNNRSNNSRYSRRLSELFAHEATHVMYEKKFGWFKTRPLAWLDKDSNSQLGIFWKEEGYAEYVAGDLSLHSQVNFSNSKFADPYGKEYAESWLAIRYLLDVQKMSLEQIFKADLIFEQVVGRAKGQRL